MNSIENFHYFCEENKINVENGVVSSFNEHVRVGCFTCSNFFECQVKYIFSKTTQNTEPKCKKCRVKCEHNRRKNRCKDCGGSGICEHNRYKNDCKDCGGSRICEHNRRKDQCKECGGSSFCEHNRYKNDCKDCGGSRFCEHNRQKRFCKDCGGSRLCKQCRMTYASNKKYLGYCLVCFIHIHPEKPVSRNYKTKEKAVVDRVIDRYSDLTWIWDKRIQDGCSRKRPDLLVDLGTHILIIEVDEQAHSDYNCSCENIRLHGICCDVGYRPVIMIRFNPDSYETLEGEKIKSCWTQNTLGIYVIAKGKVREWSERIETLFRAIEYWMVNIPDTKFPIGDGQILVLEIIELFFS